MMNDLAHQYLYNTQTFINTPILWKSSNNIKKPVPCKVVIEKKNKDDKRDTTCTRCGQTTYWCNCQSIQGN